MCPRFYDDEIKPILILEEKAIYMLFPALLSTLPEKYMLLTSARSMLVRCPLKAARKGKPRRVSRGVCRGQG
jgi:hypothetical protein